VSGSRDVLLVVCACVQIEDVELLRAVHQVVIGNSTWKDAVRCRFKERNVSDCQSRWYVTTFYSHGILKRFTHANMHFLSTQDNNTVARNSKDKVHVKKPLLDCSWRAPVWK
jgi:hypothetical protein